MDNITLSNAQKSVVGIVDFNNSVSTLNAGDVIVGTGVVGDELRVILNSTSYPGSATITDVDTITVQVGAGGGVTFNATGVTGAKQIIMKDAVGAQTISNIGSLSTAVGITNTTQSLTANWSNALLAGSNDAVTVLLDTATGAAAQTVTVSNGVEVVNVKTSGGKSDIKDITDAVASGSLKTINVAADAALRIRNLDADITTFDASASTAGVRVAFGAGKDITATGGKGDDRFTFGLGDFTDKDKVTGGAGTDRLDVTLNANLATKNQISGIETISASANGAAFTFTFNLSGNTDIKTFIVREDGGANTITLTNAEQVLQTVGYQGNETNGNQTFDNLTVNLAPGKGTGSSDATTVVVNNKDASGAEVALATGNAFNLGTLTLPNVENVTIDVQANGNANLTLSDTALTSLTLKATKDLTFNAALNSTKLTTVDATGVNGKLTIDTSFSNESVTISLGNGNNVVTVGGGNGTDDITLVQLGTGANTIALDPTTVGPNGFFIATGFNAGVGGDLIDFTGLVNFESKALNAAATGSAGVDVVAVTNANAMNVTGSDEATLIANFLALTNPTAGNDNAFDNNLFVGDLVVVNGNDSNAYIFRVTVVDATFDISGAELVGVLTGVNAAQLVPGNFS